MNIRVLVTVVLLAITPTFALAQPPDGEDVNRKTTYQYTPTKENLEAREWFQDARFGLFVHWGVYSVLGDGEWVMNNQKHPRRRLREAAGASSIRSGSTPAEWVAAREGRRHEVHHHHQQASRRLRDVRLEGLRLRHRRADAVRQGRAQGAGRGVPQGRGSSSSSITRSSTGIIPTTSRAGRTGRDAERPESGELVDAYLDYMDAPAHELLTNYGAIGGIWFDGWWDKAGGDWQLDRDLRADPRSCSPPR